MIWLFSLLLSIAQAEVVSLQYSRGQALFEGALSASKSESFDDLQISVLHLRLDQLWSAYLALDVMRLSTQPSVGPFPFVERAELLAFLFIPHICFDGLGKLSVCGGIGQGTVNVNAGRERRDYGTWNYQLLARYLIDDRWSLQAFGKYVGKVEQRVAGVDSYFSFTGLGFGLGWRY